MCAQIKGGIGCDGKGNPGMTTGGNLVMVVGTTELWPAGDKSQTVNGVWLVDLDVMT